MLWPREREGALCVCPVYMMKINIASCFLVPFGCCPRIGKLVYPCEKGIQKGYEVQS